MSRSKLIYSGDVPPPHFAFDRMSINFDALKLHKLTREHRYVLLLLTTLANFVIGCGTVIAEDTDKTRLKELENLIANKKYDQALLATPEKQQ